MEEAMKIILLLYILFASSVFAVEKCPYDVTLSCNSTDLDSINIDNIDIVLRYLSVKSELFGQIISLETNLSEMEKKRIDIIALAAKMDAMPMGNSKSSLPIDYQISILTENNKLLACKIHKSKLQKCFDKADVIASRLISKNQKSSNARIPAGVDDSSRFLTKPSHSTPDRSTTTKSDASSVSK